MLTCFKSLYNTVTVAFILIIVLSELEEGCHLG